MMVALDSTVLAYAVNRHAPEHVRAAAVVEELANGDLPWALPWPAVHDFLRLTTHPHVVARPLKPSDAWGFLGLVIASPAVRMLGPTERHAQVAVELLGSAPSEGGLPHGFEIAVLLREHGVRELLSADRAMRNYAFLSVRDPLRGEAWRPSDAPSRRYRVLGARPREG